MVQDKFHMIFNLQMLKNVWDCTVRNGTYVYSRNRNTVQLFLIDYDRVEAIEDTDV